MNTNYEIAPAPTGWVLQHQGDVLALFESREQAASVVREMWERGRRTGAPVQVDLVDRGVRKPFPFD